MIGGITAPWLAATVAIAATPFVLVLVMWRRIRATKGTNALRYTQVVQIDGDLVSAIASTTAAMKAIRARIDYVDKDEAAVTSLLSLGGAQYFLDAALRSIPGTNGTEITLRAWNALEGYQGFGWDFGYSRKLVRRLVSQLEVQCAVDTSDPGHYGNAPTRL